jgi:kinesin family protein 5
MKVENMVKLKEEFDYKSLCRRMEAELDRLVAENERQAKLRQENDEELDRTVEESRLLVMEAENRLQTALGVLLKFEVENFEFTTSIEC